MASDEKRLVIYSELAAQDREEIYSYTVHHWGVEQAEDYAQLLADTALLVVEKSTLSRPVEGTIGVYAAFVKWPNARYGHFIIFEYEADGIYILRILHSAMDVSNRLNS